MDEFPLPGMGAGRGRGAGPGRRARLLGRGLLRGRADPDGGFVVGYRVRTERVGA